MSMRLQVVLEEKEIRELRRCAGREGLTLSEWARRALRRAQRAQLGPSKESKLQALQRALQCGHPTAEINDMLEQIESGRDLR